MKWVVLVWSWFWSLFRPGPKPFKTVRVEELPEVPKDQVIYLVGEAEHLWVAAMKCPCGCSETIHLNLLHGQRPRWSVAESEDGPVTLSPSVWRKAGCKSHFFFRNGLVVWCCEHRGGDPAHAA